ncbi:hypothetical protein PR048_005623 [Dryococelus australis]|uniref:Uncharacterized protein n=1 Tax=Dryococelus australis TaxID=614101 RepID=A0ABQ9I8N7_9NEOP|nr:hypothetical protein PR048_005623 [Dryococelus australis]
MPDTRAACRTPGHKEKTTRYYSRCLTYCEYGRVQIQSSMATIIVASGISALVARSVQGHKKCLVNMGKRAVTSHMSGQVHETRIAAKKSTACISASSLTGSNKVHGHHCSIYILLCSNCIYLCSSCVYLCGSCVHMCGSCIYLQTRIPSLQRYQQWRLLGSSMLSAQKQVLGLKRVSAKSLRRCSQTVAQRRKCNLVGQKWHTLHALGLHHVPSQAH